jgi:peptidoglycan/xylan/chitin deacetylase (PgdA/CDA1 family)
VPFARILLWILSLGIVLLSGYNVLVEPVPLWIAVSVGVFYSSFVALGVMVMRLEMFGDACWFGETDRREVALTFDDGPSPEGTPRVLDALREAGLSATFFLIGEKAERHPEIVRRIVAEGHEIGVHSYRHERLYVFKTPRQIELDIRRCQDLIFEIAGVRPRFFRPPVGLMSPRIAAGVRRAGLLNVGWTVRTYDGVAHTTKESWLRNALAGLCPGNILLLHDAAEKDNFMPVSIAALPELFERIKERDYAVRPLAELVGEETQARPLAPAPTAAS